MLSLTAGFFVCLFVPSRDLVSQVYKSRVNSGTVQNIFEIYPLLHDARHMKEAVFRHVPLKILVVIHAKALTC